MIETKTGYLELNQTQFFYEEAGQGEPVVMAHAAITDRTLWDDQFNDLSKDHRAIRYDLRGSGNSAVRAGPYSDRADLLALLQALGVEQAVLMGASHGAEVIIDFAVEHPEMARALILVSASLSGFQFEGRPPRFVAEMEQALKSGQVDEAAEFGVRIWYDAGRKPNKLDPRLRQRMIEWLKDVFKNPPTSGTPQPLVPPAIERLDRLTMPTLVIAGELDDKNILQIASLLSNRIPNAKQVIFSQAAHLPNLERPEDFNQVVRGFLMGLDA